MLTLYRRHTKTCIKQYGQNVRVFRPVTKRQHGRDCLCPISCEGTLSKEGFITNRSTRKTTWEDAETVTKQWEVWGETTPPAQPEVITVEYAVDSFLTSKGTTGENVEHSTIAAFRILLEHRLLPFVRSRGIRLVQDLVSLDVTTKFVESWTNLSMKTERIPLAATTKKTELERLRAFYRYCEARQWMTGNPASQIHVVTSVAEKFGMEPDEEARLFQACLAFSDGRGSVGGKNALELFLFCSVMRFAGLRISDATSLNEHQLVPRVSGRGWALKVMQKKTKEWVYIPITETLANSLREWPFKGTLNGVRYWFWTGEGELDTAINNWYVKIQKVVETVHNQSPFRHPVTPHSFRHTFSIRNLNAGVDIHMVSKWLGHKSIRTTEKHYANAILSTRLASENAYDKANQINSTTFNE